MVTARGTLTDSSVGYGNERYKSEGKLKHQQLHCTVPVIVLRTGLHEASRQPRPVNQYLAAS
jgi:hypothetical protein